MVNRIRIIYQEKEMVEVENMFVPKNSVRNAYVQNKITLNNY